MASDCHGQTYYTRERSNSNPLQFHSGTEHEQVTPPCSPPYNGGSANQLSPIDKSRKNSPKAKRSRKLSLFSQFHFNTKSSDEKHGKPRRISSPSASSKDKDLIEVDFDSCSSTSSQISMHSLPSIPQGRCLETSPAPSRKTSAQSTSTAQSAVEKENAQIRDIIIETLKIQFENVTEYNREVCDKLSKNVCQWVKRRIEIMKEGSGQTCKIVSLVYVGAVRGNGIEFASQAMVDFERDNFTAGCYRNGHIFAMAGIMVIVLDA
ncbi:dynein light chain Tctex-type 5-B-like [Nematostella vectensis]|uniref:dynein light chain Tctex-type 5-B-like n=1 Tax=Nematostella vectensis TaxID=45351 RepID=UPI0020770F82|nr:dynein light chain Tctex-type 5-B-like [Nematostella vectensis]